MKKARPCDNCYICLAPITDFMKYDIRDPEQAVICSKECRHASQLMKMYEDYSAEEFDSEQDDSIEPCEYFAVKPTGQPCSCSKESLFSQGCVCGAPI
jgi:hypothetical protein